VAYLLYLAWITWRDKSELDTSTTNSERPGPWRITWTAVAFLTQFIDPSRPPVGEMLYLSAC